MKKCPKCGTILDDSKKKCYMCGAELTKKIDSNFAENFDAKIGAQTTRAQDNVFNNGVDIKANGKSMVGRNSNGAYFNNNSSSMGYFSNNNMNRPPASNGFQGFDMNKNPNQVNISEKIKQNNSRKKDGATADPTIMNFFEKSKGPNISPTPHPVENKSKKENKVKKDNPPSEPFKINFNFIFNTLCFIVFLGIVLFGYLKFIKPKKEDNSSLNRLSYVIDKGMTLSQDDKYSKYYTKGEHCAIKVSYGETTDVDGFTDNYFDQIRADYSNDPKHLTRSDEFKINGNKWSSLSILEFVDNPASSGGFSTVTKYKYVSIVKDGNYYTIIYANTEDDNNCSEIYENFMNTLDFK